MADPLLNTLCSICHISTPKYTCPGCNTHTCSLECNKKHKSWANCSGKRDPTAYMPASRLKTAAGIDHDYNFLSAIERERERNQREIIEKRRLFSQKELCSQLDDPYSFRKQWFGEEVRFQPIVGGAGAGGGGGGGGPRMFGSDGEEDSGGGDGDEDNGRRAEARNNRRNIPAKASQLTQRVRQRLAAENIRVVQMPVGMTRQRENTTSWNRKARRINWCVEWILYEGEEQGEEGLKKHTRIRHNALETAPLYKALGNSMAWYKKGQKAEGDDAADDEDIEPAQAGRRKRVLIREVKESEQERGGAMQDSDWTTWHPRTQYPTQSPFTTTWSSDTGATTTSWDADGEVEARRRHRFYLLRPLTVAGKPKELIPVSAAEDLSAALAGRTVLEFPTIYVLPPSPPPSSAAASSSSSSPQLPEGHILGSTERRAPAKRQQQAASAAAATKRKAGTGPGSKDDDDDAATARQQPSHKRQALLGGGGGGEAGIPAVRQSDKGQRGGRGNNTARGRGRGGGRGATLPPAPKGRRRRQGVGDEVDAEEGEVNSDGDEVMVVAAAARPRGPGRRTATTTTTTARAVVVVEERADTSSSDPDSSSDEEDEDEDDNVQDGQGSGFWGAATQRPRGGGMMDVDGDEEEATTTSAPTAAEPAAAPVQGDGTTTTSRKKPSGLGLVDYGSDSSDDDDGSEDDDADADLATLEPENPELVAGAIQEIVGLLT